MKIYAGSYVTDPGDLPPVSFQCFSQNLLRHKSFKLPFSLSPLSVPKLMSLQRHPPQRVIFRSFFFPTWVIREFASVGEGTIELNATQTIVQTTSVETLPLANVLAMTNKYWFPVPKRKLTNSHFFPPVGASSMLRPKGLSATCRSVALQANGTLLMHMDSRYMPWNSEGF